MRFISREFKSGNEGRVQLVETDTGLYVCPICGFLERSPCYIISAEGYINTTGDVCPRCYTEYGYDDMLDSRSGEAQEDKWAQLRTNWLKLEGATRETVQLVRRIGVVLDEANAVDVKEVDEEGSCCHEKFEEQQGARGVHLKIYERMTWSGEWVKFARTFDGDGVCPVCGYIVDGMLPYRQTRTVMTNGQMATSALTRGTGKTCPSCATRWGYDDFVKTAESLSQLEKWEQLRTRWLERVGRTKEVEDQLLNTP